MDILLLTLAHKVGTQRVHSMTLRVIILDRWTLQCKHSEYMTMPLVSIFQYVYDCLRLADSRIHHKIIYFYWPSVRVHKSSYDHVARRLKRHPAHDEYLLSRLWMVGRVVQSLGLPQSIFRRSCRNRSVFSASEELWTKLLKQRTWLVFLACCMATCTDESAVLLDEFRFERRTR